MQRRLHSCNVDDCVQRHEVVDHSVIASRGYLNARFLKFARVGFTFVTKRIVLGSYHERRWQAVELIVARSKWRHIRKVACLVIGRVKVPSILHEVTCQKTASSVLVIRVRLMFPPTELPATAMRFPSAPNSAACAAVPLK